MKKSKIGIIAVVLVMVLSLFGCGNSNLNSEQKSILHKSYNELNDKEKITLATIESDMSEEDKKNYTNDLKRLFIEEHMSVGMSKEEAEKLWSTERDYEQRKKSGQLTEKEKAEENARKQTATDLNNKVGQYLDAEKKIQENINSTLLKDETIKHYSDKITVKSDPNNDGFLVTVNLFRPYSIKVGEVTSIRNQIIDSIKKVISANEVQIEFTNNEKSLDKYIFTTSKGWDKEVSPWKEN